MSEAGLELNPPAENGGPATNGLKGQSPKCASPIQEPTLFTPVHWTVDEENLLDTYFKVCQHLCVRRTGFPTDVMAVFCLHNLPMIVQLIESSCWDRSS